MSRKRKPMKSNKKMESNSNDFDFALIFVEFLFLTIVLTIFLISLSFVSYFIKRLSLKIPRLEGCKIISVCGQK